MDIEQSIKEKLNSIGSIISRMEDLTKGVTIINSASRQFDQLIKDFKTQSSELEAEIQTFESQNHSLGSEYRRELEQYKNRLKDVNSIFRVKVSRQNNSAFASSDANTPLLQQREVAVQKIDSQKIRDAIATAEGLEQVSRAMNDLVQADTKLVDDAMYNVQETYNNAENARKELSEAEGHQKSSVKCIIFIVIVVIIAVIVVSVIAYLTLSRSK